MKRYISIIGLILPFCAALSAPLDLAGLFGEKDGKNEPKPETKVQVIKPAAKPAAKPTASKRVKTVAEKPVERVVYITNVIERIVEKPVEKTVYVTNEVKKIVEKQVEKTVYVTNEVEKLITDRVKEGELEAKNTVLSEDNDELRKALALERDKRERLERVATKEQVRQLTGRPAKISASSTVYNRKEGVACFDGKVYLDDEQYQLHADKVFLFSTPGSNDVNRIVAIGHVAMTNETKRAYGAKVTYTKRSGLVVLYGGDGELAIVKDESKAQDQTVSGRKIRFWIDAEQVEVVDAEMSAPTGGAGLGDVKNAITR